MDFIQTIIISIVEGLTEFLPVSSTGHMIIVENLLGVPFETGFPDFAHFDKRKRRFAERSKRASEI